MGHSLQTYLSGMSDASGANPLPLTSLTTRLSGASGASAANHLSLTMRSISSLAMRRSALFCMVDLSCMDCTFILIACNVVPKSQQYVSATIEWDDIGYGSSGSLEPPEFQCASVSYSLVSSTADIDEYEVTCTTPPGTHANTMLVQVRLLI